VLTLAEVPYQLNPVKPNIMHTMDDLEHNNEYPDYAVKATMP
jgi:hypothetical protein